MTTCPETDCPFITLSGWCGLTACIRRSVTTQIKANPVIVIPDDYVRVVRCRDCKHSIENAKHIDVACERSYDLDFYCAAGERKDSE